VLTNANPHHLFFRFLKRIQQTASWEEVGDDIAREKASQVLRDAVSGLLDNRKPSAEGEESTNEDSTTGTGTALVPTVSAQTSTDVEEHDYSSSSPQHSASSSRHHHHQQYKPARIMPATLQPQSMMMPSQVPSSSPYSPVPYPPYQPQQQRHHQHYPPQHHSSPPPYQLHPSAALPPPPPPLLPPVDTATEALALERKRRRPYMAETALPHPPPPVPFACYYNRVCHVLSILPQSIDMPPCCTFVDDSFGGSILVGSSLASSWFTV
jgi:hypothetical protein